MTQGELRRRFIALVVVLALHCLFLLLLWVREPITRRVAHATRSSVLFFIEKPRPEVTPAPVVQSRPTRATPTIVPEPKAPEAQPSIAPVSPNSSATIDWTAQATQAAAAVVDKAIREETRECDPSDTPNSFLPPCHPKTKPFEWTGEPRVGFSGGLPYVRVGKRCAIGLGFFGCAIGRLPPAKGDLFEGMDDAERDRSSVPSPDPPANDR